MVEGVIWGPVRQQFDFSGYSLYRIVCFLCLEKKLSSRFHRIFSIFVPPIN